MREPALLILDGVTGTVIFPQTTTSAEFSVERSRLLGFGLEPPPPEYPDPESTKAHSLALAFIGEDGQHKQHLILSSQDECQIADVRAWLDEWAGLPVE
jgi:hypothetical protein